MRQFALALLAATTLSTGAMAADMAVKAPRPVAPPPAFSWTGFYIGAHVGAGWGTTESNLIDLHNPAGPGVIPLGIALSQTQVNGWLGGAQVGYDWQIGNIVLGAEATYSWTDIKGTSPCLVVFSCKTDVDWIATAAGRFGVTWDRTLVYVKGGVAWAKVDYSTSLNIGGVSVNASVSDTRFGGLLGAGVEQAIGNGWSAKVEYNYIDFRNENYNNVPVLVTGIGNPANANVDIKQQLHTVKFGLNYKFGGGF